MKVRIINIYICYEYTQIKYMFKVVRKGYNGCVPVVFLMERMNVWYMLTVSADYRYCTQSICKLIT